jgi:hypothetical protein
MEWLALPPGLESAKWMVESLPTDIRAWIDAKGGYTQLPMKGYWTLTAAELWKMGYRKCAD